MKRTKLDVSEKPVEATEMEFMLPKKSTFAPMRIPREDKPIRPRKPKIYTLEQIKKQLSPEELIEVGWQKHLRIVHTPTPIECLVRYCTEIAHSDMNFQNLRSEVEYAKKIAQNNLERAEKIRSLIEQIPQEQAGLALAVLHIMEFPYMRVLGDQMQDIPFEGTNLEDWVRSICYKCESLKAKVELEDTYIRLYNRQFEREPKNNEML